MKRLGLLPGLDGKRIALQGCGNVAYWASTFCREAGARVVGVSDSQATIARPAGLTEDDVLVHKRGYGSVAGFADAVTYDDPRAVLELDCDISIPAAVESQLTENNASRIKAKVIVEGANGPTTPEADDILAARGRMVIPDLYANAGGVISRTSSGSRTSRTSNTGAWMGGIARRPITES